MGWPSAMSANIHSPLTAITSNTLVTCIVCKLIAKLTDYKPTDWIARIWLFQSTVNAAHKTTAQQCLTDWAATRRFCFYILLERATQTRKQFRQYTRWRSRLPSSLRAQLDVNKQTTVWMLSQQNYCTLLRVFESMDTTLGARQLARSAKWEEILDNGEIELKINAFHVHHRCLQIWLNCTCFA